MLAGVQESFPAFIAASEQYVGVLRGGVITDLGVARAARAKNRLDVDMDTLNVIKGGLLEGQ